jgi:hypothetical protein
MHPAMERGEECPELWEFHSVCSCQCPTYQYIHVASGGILADSDFPATPSARMNQTLGYNVSVNLCTIGLSLVKYHWPTTSILELDEGKFCKGSQVPTFGNISAKFGYMWWI